MGQTQPSIALPRERAAEAAEALALAFARDSRIDALDSWCVFWPNRPAARREAVAGSR
ncbi:MAG: hypothetical protein U0232_24105 [Thermomicrobiales bacterium]